jgi:(S)-mandelate dehydrogenase
MVDRGPAETAGNGAAARLRQRFPTVGDLRARARARVPRFGFDFVDGGANEEYCVARNTAAFQAIELLPHYCLDGKVTTDTELFGRKYAAPIGVAPMGSAGLMWPGAEKLLAAQAQRRRIPYVLATPGNASIEEIAAIAPDVFWFQLYRFAGNDHAITFDLVRRADEAGAHVLVPTVDSAGKSAARHPQRLPGAVPDQPVDHLSGADRAGLDLAASAQRYADHREPRALRREGEPERDRRSDAAALGRQPHLGGT